MHLPDVLLNDGTETDTYNLFYKLLLRGRDRKPSYFYSEMRTKSVNSSVNLSRCACILFTSILSLSINIVVNGGNAKQRQPYAMDSLKRNPLYFGIELLLFSSNRLAVSDADG